MGITRKKKMHSEVISQTAGLPLCSLPLAQFPQSPPSLACPASRNNRRVKPEPWNYTRFTSPPSSSSPCHPTTLQTSNSESVRGRGERRHGLGQPSVNPVSLFLPFNTSRYWEGGKTRRVHSYRGLWAIMSLITEDEFGGRSVSSVVLVRIKRDVM